MAEFTDLYACVPYVTPAELLTCCSAAADAGLGPDSPQVLDAIEDASLILYYLTGRQFGGTCQKTVRPCIPCMDCACTCGSCKPNQVNIGLWPVTDLISARMGGETVTGADLAALFHIDEYKYLVRNDGDSLPHGGSPYALSGGVHDTDLGNDRFVFEITVEYGMPVPRLLTRATRALASELVARCLDQECKLPQNVKSISRQGISMELVSADDLLVKGRTGIYEVDLAIQVFNPSNLQSPSFVWSGQISHGRRVNT